MLLKTRLVAIGGAAALLIIADNSDGRLPRQNSESVICAMKVVHLCNLPMPEAHPDSGKVPCHPGRWELNLALAQRAHTGIVPALRRIFTRSPKASRCILSLRRTGCAQPRHARSLGLSPRHPLGAGGPVTGRWFHRAYGLVISTR